MSEQRHRLAYACEHWEVDLVRRELRARGEPVPLGGRAFEIMEVLVRSAGALITKDEMMARIWPGVIVGENTLHVHVSAVRKALGAERRLLKTTSGRGYRLTGTWTRIGDDSPEFAPSPAPAVAGSAFGNLPVATAGLVGRADTVKHLLDLTSAYRAVTLTGPGGIGKTKLALEVARCLLPVFAGDCWLVDLVSLSEPGLAASTLAGALSLDLDRLEPSPSSIARAIGGRRLLLVIDNCEHVIDAAAELVETILRACPRVSVLATSRELLRIDGEFAFRVPALDVPPPNHRDAGDLVPHSAVELFIARMGDLPADPSGRAAALAAIGGLCRRLDGMPLAIELAASRAATLGPEQVLARLDDRFGLLTGGRRTVPRHRTLRATLDWSYELLPEWERRLLRHLAIFPAGFTLEAAVGVCADDALSAARIAEGISNLVEKSLVDLDKAARVPRWRLLETTRTYALARLDEAGEAEEAMRLQAEYFCRLFQATAPTPELKSLGAEMSGFVREIDNVRAVLDWAFSAEGAAAVGIRLTAAYVPVWLSLSLVDECRARGKQAIAALEQQPPSNPRERMQLHAALGWQQLSGVPVPGGTPSWRAVLEIAGEIGDTDYQLRALWALWVDCKNSARPGDGLAIADRFIALAAEAPDPGNRFIGERLRGVSLHHCGRHAEARVSIESMLTHYRAPEDSGHAMRVQFHQQAMAHNALARISWVEGHQGRALEEVEENIRRMVEVGHQLSLSNVLAESACPVAFLVGDLDLCERYTAQLREESRPRALDVWNAFADCFDGDLQIRRGQRAAGIEKLLGGIEKLRRTNFLFYHTAFLSALAAGLAQSGEIAAGRAAIEEALVQCSQTGEAWFLPELHRIKGEIAVLADANSTLEAERDFAEALRIARDQRALSWELRAATSLVRLRLIQGKLDDPRDLLAPVLVRFPAGTAVPDVQAAAALLSG